MGHIAVSRGADAIVVAPASADFLAKLAHGHADDLLSTLCLARECPLFVAPAMNRQMWANAATQRNVAQLAGRRRRASSGPTPASSRARKTAKAACSSPTSCSRRWSPSRQPKVLAGKRVLLTAGPTFEAIDPVRGITNSSSGKMGFALAQAAAEAGAEVTVVAGPSRAGDAAPASTRIDTTSAAQMADAVLARVDGQRRVHRRRRGRRLHARRRRTRRSSRSPSDALTLTLEADGRHPRDRRRARQRAVLRRLRRREPRRRRGWPRKSASARSCRC